MRGKVDNLLVRKCSQQNCIIKYHHSIVINIIYLQYISFIIVSFKSHIRKNLWRRKYSFSPFEHGAKEKMIKGRNSWNSKITSMSFFFNFQFFLFIVNSSFFRSIEQFTIVVTIFISTAIKVKPFKWISNYVFVIIR
jgi:hypothetical protein